jgi:hypothetical protein
VSRHDTHSPSAWPPLMSCMGFNSNPTPSDVAMRGTLQHEYLEALGKSDKQGKENLQLKLTANEIDNVRFVFETVEDLMIRHGVQVEKVIFEQRLRILSSSLIGKKGTGDVIIVCKDKVIILDAKFGAVKEYDPQLKLYALGAMQMYGKTKSEYWISYGMTRMNVYDTISLQEAQKFFDDGLDKIKYFTENPDEIKYKMNSFCQFCTKFDDCPELNKIPQTLSRIVAPEYDMSLAEELLTGVDSLTNLEDMNIDQLGNLQVFLKYLEKYTDKVKTTLTERVLNGEDSLMYKISNRKGNVFVAKKEELIKDALQRDENLDVFDLLTSQNISSKSFREWIYDVDNASNKKDFEATYGDYMRTGKSSQSLRKRSAKDIEKLISQKENENEKSK